MSLSDLPGWHSDVDSTGSAGSSCGSFKSSIGSNKSTNSVRVEEIRRRIRRSGESNSTTRHKPNLASPLLADNHGNELDSETNLSDAESDASAPGIHMQFACEDNYPGDIADCDISWESLDSDEKEAVVEILTSTENPEDCRQLIILYGDDLLTYSDQFGNVSLHYATNGEIARLILAGVSDKSVLLEARNDDNQTVLHAASIMGNPDVIAYICLLRHSQMSTSLLRQLSQLLTASDLYGNTPLHYAATKETAEALVRVAENSLIKTITKLERNMKGKTPLHKAAKDGREDVVDYLLDNRGGVLWRLKWHPMLRARDHLGNTALHYCRTGNIAGILVNAITKHRREYILDVLNKLGQNAIHTACCLENDAEVLETLLASIETKHPFIEFFKKQDDNHNTPLYSAIDCGNDRIVEFILQKCNSSATINQLLSHRNKSYKNSLHIAVQSRAPNRTFDVLEDYYEALDFDEMLQVDDKGNSPVHSLAGSYNINHFSRLIMRPSLPRRRMLVHSEKISTTKGYNATANNNVESDAEFSMLPPTKDCMYSKMINTWQRMLIRNKLSSHYDPRLLKVMLTALNQYPASSTSTFFTSMISTNIYDLLSTSNSHTVTWFYDDINVKQTALHKLDTPKLHGQPKVILRAFAGENPCGLVPAGPDFMIISLKVKSLSIYKEMELELSDNIDGVLDILRSQPNVVSVSVDSTLSRHAITDGGSLCLKPDTPENCILVTGEPSQRGRALIICNTTDRQGWYEQYNQAYEIVSIQMGLETKVLKDLERADIISEVKDFSNTPQQQGQMAALVIMAHGDTNGNITGMDDRPISVNDIVNALCTSLPNIPKLVLLSFCRGANNTGYNRAWASFESKEMAGLVESEFLYKQPIIRQKDELISAPTSQWIDIPENCYLLFTTLPDSKSPTHNTTFEIMKNCLRDIYLCANPKTNKHTPVIDSQPAAKPGTTTGSKVLPQVEIVQLFTDVAGLTRERSQFSIYPNYCYTIKANSMNLVIDVLPPRPAASEETAVEKVSKCNSGRNFRKTETRTGVLVRMRVKLALELPILDSEAFQAEDKERMRQLALGFPSLELYDLDRSLNF